MRLPMCPDIRDMWTNGEHCGVFSEQQAKTSVSLNDL